MAVIKRGIGRSPTEKTLAALADKIFLNLWTYPNLFKRDGQELCDVLAVCGNDVLIFSDKNIAWQKGDPARGLDATLPHTKTPHLPANKLRIS
jgi:hypothetical protein